MSSFGSISFFYKGLKICSQNYGIIFRRPFSEWHIISALCLERKPVITQPLTPLEHKYWELLQKVEIEKSHFSDHEMKQKQNKIISEKMSKSENEDADIILKQTAQDFEDACLEELNKFQFESRITDSDLKNNCQSMKRKLDSTLVLVVKQRLGNDFRWCLPQTIYKEGETLRQTAERAFKEVSSSQLKIQFMGNAPVGFYKYKYPKLLRENGVCGAKVFFFKAQLLPQKLNNFEVEQSENVTDYMWLTHMELKNVFHPVYCKVVKSFLLSDSFGNDDTNDSKFKLLDNCENESPSILQQHSN